MTLGPPVAGWAPRPHLCPDLLQGRTVRLEALAGRHVDDLWAALVQGSGEELWTYLPYGPFGSRAELAEHVAGLVEDPGLSALAIVVGGRAQGTSAYLREVADDGVVETGHVALGAALQRSTAATEAAYLMMRHAFEAGYRRYEWKCDALNAASRAAAERFGFVLEGVFRQHRVVKGRSRDTAWFSVLDSEWPALRAAYDAWLDPANFDPEGRQLSPLATRSVSGC